VSDDARDAATWVTRRLTGWGAASLLAGAVLSRHASPAVRAFGQQSAGWGAVDLGIVGVSRARRSSAPTAPALRRVLVVNAALDVGYVAVGALVLLRRGPFGRRLDDEQARGHGAAVVLQGLALLVLDASGAGRLG
jgi:hypothetical protein